MKKTVLALCLGALMVPVARAAAQAPRDTPPPAIENARRERELRATIAAGTATKDTYLELAAVLQRQHRPLDVIEAMRTAATLDSDSAEAQHRFATYCWEIANKDTTLDSAVRVALIREGIAAEDRTLALVPDHRAAMTYKNILLRMLANQTADPAERARLVADADALRNRVIQMQKESMQNDSPQRTDGPEPPPPPPPPFTGFAEQYDITVARIAPLRVGGDVRMPTKTTDVKPVYPAEALAANVQGVVIIETVLDESGSVANARVLRSIPALDQAALAAVSRWQFTPTSLNGQPVGVMMTVTVNFTLQR